MQKGDAMRAYYLPILTAFAVAALIAGCGTTPEGDASQSGAPVTDATKPGAKPGAGAQTGPIAKIDVTKPGAVAGADPRLKTGALAQRSIYYDYDQFDVKDQYRGLVETHAKYLRENPSAKILIQGNTDERGGNEYNLALGQKRAEAVRKAMASLGVADSQMEAVSLGKEKPKAMGSNEAAWAENRRADIVY